jgi:PAS domain S-box-containing protein
MPNYAAYLSVLLKEACLGIEKSGKIEYINQAAQDLLAYSADVLLGQNIYQFLKPSFAWQFSELNEPTQARVEFCLANQQWLKLQFHILPIDEVSLAIRCLPIQPISWQNKKHLARQLIQKITTHYYQNQGLIYQINKLLPYNVFVMDVDTKIVSYSNFDWYLNYGYSEQNLSEWNQLLKIIHLEDASDFLQKFEAWITKPSERLSFKYRFQTKNGQLRWAIIRFRPYQYDIQGKLIKVIGVAQDITSYKETIDQLRLNEAYLQALFNSSIENIFLMDKAYQIVWLNKNASLSSEKFGFPRARVGDDIRNYVLPNHTIYFEKNFQLALQGKSVVVEREIPIPEKNNAWLKLTYFPLYSNDNEIIGVWMAGLDITTQKEAENILILARQKAESAAAFKEQFLSLMSHELRTPLNSVLGVCNLLKSTPLNPQQLEYTKILEYSASYLLALIGNILDYNRLEVGQLRVESIDFNLRSLLKELIEILQINAQEKGLALQLNIDPEIPAMVIGDPLRLRQILINLLGNAIKFTHRGWVKLEVLKNDKSPQDIDNQQFMFIISDSGIGIPNDKLKVIFERFNQGNVDINRKFGGTGLGLAITEKLLEIMGSQILVESEEGIGSKFYFSLQLAKSNQKSVSKPVETQPNLPLIQAGSLHILVTEDNLINQKIITKLLKNWGMECEICNSGREALEKIKNESYDLILMDIQMPEMSGFDAAQKIRSQAADYYQKIPIIALTAHVWSESDKEYELKGMNDFVFKPFEPDDLKMKILRYGQAFKESRNQLNKSLSHSISQLANYDAQFRNELNVLNIEILTELEKALNQAIESQNMEIFTSIVHKSKISIQIMKAEKLENLLVEIHQQMVKQVWDLSAIKPLAKAVEIECKKLYENLLADMSS